MAPSPRVTLTDGGSFATAHKQAAEGFSMFFVEATNCEPAILKSLGAALSQMKKYLELCHPGRSKVSFPSDPKPNDLQLSNIKLVPSAMALRRRIIDWCHRFYLITTRSYSPESKAIFPDCAVLPHVKAVEFGLAHLAAWADGNCAKGKRLTALSATDNPHADRHHFVASWVPELDESRKEAMARMRKELDQYFSDFESNHPYFRYTQGKDLDHFRWLALSQCKGLPLREIKSASSLRVGTDTIAHAIADTAALILLERHPSAPGRPMKS